MCWGGMEVVDTCWMTLIATRKVGRNALAEFGRGRFEAPESPKLNHQPPRTSYEDYEQDETNDVCELRSFILRIYVSRFKFMVVHTRNLNPHACASPGTASIAPSPCSPLLGLLISLLRFIIIMAVKIIAGPGGRTVDAKRDDQVGLSAALGLQVHVACINSIIFETASSKASTLARVVGGRAIELHIHVRATT